MVKEQRKKSYWEQVSVDLKKNPRLLLLPLFVVLAGVYFYHWFVTLHLALWRLPDKDWLGEAGYFYFSSLPAFLYQG